MSSGIWLAVGAGLAAAVLISINWRMYVWAVLILFGMGSRIACRAQGAADANPSFVNPRFVRSPERLPCDPLAF